MIYSIYYWVCPNTPTVPENVQYVHIHVHAHIMHMRSNDYYAYTLQMNAGNDHPCFFTDSATRDTRPTPLPPTYLWAWHTVHFHCWALRHTRHLLQMRWLQPRHTAPQFQNFPRGRWHRAHVRSLYCLEKLLAPRRRSSCSSCFSRLIRQETRETASNKYNMWTYQSINYTLQCQRTYHFFEGKWRQAWRKIWRLVYFIRLRCRYEEMKW